MKKKKLLFQGISFIQRLGRHDSYFSHAEGYISTFPYAQAQVVTLEVLRVTGDRSILPGELASDGGIGVGIQSSVGRPWAWGGRSGSQQHWASLSAPHFLPLLTVFCFSF